MLDEQSRYLYHLQQLRRINTGDDTADMPGYGLYLLRLPVSVLPGSKTFMGKGAAVTVKASHYLTPDLLPTTFEDFVTNNLADKLALFIDSILDLDAFRTLDPESIRNEAARSHNGETQTGSRRQEKGEGNKQEPIRPLAQVFRAATLHSPSATSNGPGVRTDATSSELAETMGPELILPLVADIKQARENSTNRDLSTRDWLRTQIKASYRYMRDNSTSHNFQRDAINYIGDLVARREYCQLRICRDQWITSLPGFGQPPQSATICVDGRQLPTIRTIESLAFGIIVTAYGLDRQLKADMENINLQKGCIPGNPCGECFYELMPTPRARALYNAYVECKWPVHVFSVDPVVDQQNVEQVSSVRSELQVALAVAASTGQISFNNAEQYARRLETDIETIGLNRTAVGFGAGEQTFGWKFYPRVQTHQPESNPRRIADLLLFNGPGPYYDVRHRKIEPGLRECTALIVMPTFVPYLRLETTTNWFGLIGKCAEQYLDSQDILELGHKVQLARAALASVQQTCAYRSADLAGLKTRVEQLEAQLPLQSQLVSFPYENTLNGSEVFTSGYSHLAPQLRDWYGTPAACKEFSVFLTGNHFSVHETNVIAGGINLPQDKFHLVSRNVMRITVPANAHVETRPVPMRDPRTGMFVMVLEPSIDIHVVSPNGQSNHLLIKLPVEPLPCPPPSGFHWGLPTVYSANYTFNAGQSPAFSFVPGQTFLPPTNELVIEAPLAFAPPGGPATLVLTVEAGGKVLTTYTAALPANFDVRHNAFFIIGTDFNALNNALMTSVAAALNNVTTEPTEPLVVCGKLVVGSAVIPIDNRLTIALNKVVKP